MTSPSVYDRSPKMLTPNEYDVFFSFLENTMMKNAY